MIQEISVGVVVLGAAYWILRKVLRQLAGEEVTGGCEGCSGCSVPPAQRPAAQNDTGTCTSGSCSTGQCGDRGHRA